MISGIMQGTRDTGHFRTLGSAELSIIVHLPSTAGIQRKKGN
jgi:hypothetical protein